MPRFSVVLPAFNAERFIEQTIGSILAQTLGDFEIVVVDDGSSDATAERASRLDSRVKIVKQANRGIAHARNTGIAATCGDAIAFIDHDDVWHPQKLAVQAEVLNRRPECGIVFGEFRRWDPATPPLFPDDKLDPEQIDTALSGFILHRLVQTNWVLLSTAVVRREVFDRIGWFDPTMPPADDWDFMLRASEQFEFVKLAQALALYRVHAGQTSLKLTPTNTEYELRLRALARLRHIGGAMPDLAEVRRRQFRALFNYGLAQYDAGLYRKSCANFRKSMHYRATSGKAAAYLVASYVRAIFQR